MGDICNLIDLQTIAVEIRGARLFGLRAGGDDLKSHPIPVGSVCESTIERHACGTKVTRASDYQYESLFSSRKVHAIEIANEIANPIRWSGMKCLGRRTAVAPALFVSRGQEDRDKERNGCDTEVCGRFRPSGCHMVLPRGDQLFQEARTSTAACQGKCAYAYSHPGP